MDSALSPPFPPQRLQIELGGLEPGRKETSGSSLGIWGVDFQVWDISVSVICRSWREAKLGPDGSVQGRPQAEEGASDSGCPGETNSDPEVRESRQLEPLPFHPGLGGGGLWREEGLQSLGADFLEGVDDVEGSEGRAKKEAKDLEISLPWASGCTGWSMEGPGQKVINRPKSWEKSRQMDRIGLFFFLSFQAEFRF